MLTALGALLSLFCSKGQYLKVISLRIRKKSSKELTQELRDAFGHSVDLLQGTMLADQDFLCLTMTQLEGFLLSLILKVALWIPQVLFTLCHYHQCYLEWFFLPLSLPTTYAQHSRSFQADSVPEIYHSVTVNPQRASF